MACSGPHNQGVLETEFGTKTWMVGRGQDGEPEQAQNCAGQWPGALWMWVLLGSQGRAACTHPLVGLDLRSQGVLPQGNLDAPQGT